MSASWREDDEEFKVGGAKGGLRAKPRFSFNEVKVLLEAVKRNRYIILRKFNQGVSAETKKQTWAEITNQINGLGENHREVRQIMKKWADLKCDGKRRIATFRGPNGSNLRKKNLGPVEKMVHKILRMSPSGDGDSEQEPDDDEESSKLYPKGLTSSAANYSYLGLTDSSISLPGGASYDMSPLSSPEKELGDPFHSSSDFDLELGDEGERNMDFDENDDSLFSSAPASLPPPSSAAALDPLPDNALLRVKPVHTYSRSSQNHIQNHNYSRPMPGPSSSAASTSSGFPSASDSKAAAVSTAAPPLSQSPTSSNMTASSLPRPPPASSANDSTSDRASSSSSILPPSAPPPAPSAAVSSSSGASATAAPSSFVHRTSGSNPCDPLPAGASSRRSQDTVGQMATQSLQQQRASRMLLTSMSQSMEMLAQSVQLLVESQQEFVQESLLLQRETVDVLRDFSNTALTMLRDKGSSGHQAQQLHPPPRF
ncbi:flocculation protein FLO11 isoform X2 [Hippoglossus hippoglossus]|uniref:flocculation protein FLO11 isoform X2 n=1 Tax=Hippoglossus hippoglossus TaxID=8267 RepID=UPI00148B3D54|nr:flocculation protein FLO11 isoform X2 [Hippoglossus hippoglossus]